MSTNEEEIRALESTKKFLFDLLNPQETKKIPKEIRQRASRCLKHYPLLIDAFVEDRHDVLASQSDLEKGLEEARNHNFVPDPRWKEAADNIHEDYESGGKLNMDQDVPSSKMFYDKGSNRIEVVPYYVSTQKMAAVDVYIDTGHSCDKMEFNNPQVLRDMAKAFTDAAEWLEMKEEADHNNRMFRDTKGK